jgi:hypothetical protein
MKTSTKAKLGAGTLAVATMFSACPQPTQETITITKAPEIDSETLSLGEGLEIKLIYRKGTDVSKIKTAAANFANNSDPSLIDVKNGMTLRGGSYKIIVEYSDSGIPKYNYLIATNGETVRIHNDWLLSNANISAGRLQFSFAAMLDLPAVAEVAMSYDRATNTITIVKANARSNHRATRSARHQKTVAHNYT